LEQSKPNQERKLQTDQSNIMEFNLCVLFLDLCVAGLSRCGLSAEGFAPVARVRIRFVHFCNLPE
jgi:hypothetical protein